MAAGGREALERQLFHQAYISPLAAVRDLFEALKELRGEARGPDNDKGRCVLANYVESLYAVNMYHHN